MVTFSELPQFTMRGHGGGVTILMLVTGILVILAAILPQADNTLFFGRYSEIQDALSESSDLRLFF